jgi:hypothetical protein
MVISITACWTHGRVRHVCVTVMEKFSSCPAAVGGTNGLENVTDDEPKDVHESHD